METALSAKTDPGAAEKAALAIGKKYAKGGIKAGRAVAKAIGTARGRSKIKAGAVDFKKKKLTTKVRIVKKIAKNAGKAAYKGSGTVLKDMDTLGDVADAKGLTGVSQKLKDAAAVGLQHRKAIKDTYSSVKKKWHDTIEEHNPRPGV